MTDFPVPHYFSESIEVGLAKEFLISHTHLEAETLLTETCDGNGEDVSHFRNTFRFSAIAEKQTLNIFYKIGDTR